MSDRHVLVTDFLQRHGWGSARAEPLGADWSNRHYRRLRREDGARSVLLDSEHDPSLPSFVRVAHWLRSQDLHAPEVLAVDLDQRLALMEDLQVPLVSQAIGEGADEWVLYQHALDVIVHLQSREPPYWLPVMDDEVLLGLLDVFLEHPHCAADASAREAFSRIWRRLLPAVALTGPRFLYRDYHCENMLWLTHGEGLWRLGLVDFQDAHRGPVAYDLVSLLQDARRDLAPGLGDHLETRWLAHFPSIQRADLARALAILGAQRAMRILGVLHRLASRGRTLPPQLDERVRRHLWHNLAHDALRELREWCEEHLTSPLRHPADASLR